MPAAPDVTVLTPAYAAEATLPATLAAVRALTGERILEVIVVDDGSPDRTSAVAEAAAAEDDRVRLLRRPNGGEAAALNTGWRAARGRYVALVEADVEPAPDWLERCLSVLEADPDVWAVGGTLEVPLDDPWVARIAGYEVEEKMRARPRRVAHLTSANVVYRREAFEVAGPFDERLVNASLDSVFNARLGAAGKALIYEAAARALHRYKPTLAGFLRRSYAYGRYRVHDPALELYPADRLFAVRVAVSGGALVGLAAMPLAAIVPGPPRWALLGAGPALLATALALEVPAAARIATRRRDLPAALAAPPVRVLRNMVGAVGYGVGAVRKALGRA